MANNKIETILSAINGGLDHSILVGKSELFVYADGKRTSNDPVGIKVNVALPGNRLAPLTVKIEEIDALPKLTDEQIGESCASMNFIFVKFLDCKVNIYTMNGNMGMTATAKGVQIVNSSK